MNIYIEILQLNKFENYKWNYINKKVFRNLAIRIDKSNKKSYINKS